MVVSCGFEWAIFATWEPVLVEALKTELALADKSYLVLEAPQWLLSYYDSAGR